MKRRGGVSELLLAGAMLIAGAPTVAGDWTQWRGDARDGVAGHFSAPKDWPESLRKVWSIDAGAGIASPVVAGGKIWLLTREGDDEVVTSYDARDGSRIWRKTYPARFIPNSQATSPRRFPDSLGLGPFATPLVDGGTLYTLGVNRVLSAFDATSGELRWRHAYFPAAQIPDKLVWVCPPCNGECDKKHYDAPGTCPDCGMALTAVGLETTATNDGSRGNYYGAAGSPLVHGEVGLLEVGTPGESALIAFDRRTGEERWRAVGPPVSSSSPVVAEFGGVPQAVVLTRESCTGVSLRDGKTLWSHPVSSNAQIVTPLVAGDLVLFSEYRGPATALRISRDGEGWKAVQVWQSEDMRLYMSTPVRVGQRLYGLYWSRKGQFVALDLASGAKLWATEGRDTEHASLVAAGGWLLATTSDGELLVLRDAGDHVERVRRYEVAESPIWAHPALCDEAILIKDESRLTLWTAKSAAPATQAGAAARND
jgi:outer membrane protein assembly factor BamB